MLSFNENFGFPGVPRAVPWQWEQYAFNMLGKIGHRSWSAIETTVVARIVHQTER